MPAATAAALAAEIAASIRTHGHLTDVTDPAQATRSSLVCRSGYAEASKSVRRAFLVALNDRLRVETRPDYDEGVNPDALAFGPLPACIAWANRTSTRTVLRTLDTLAKESR